MKNYTQLHIMIKIQMYIDMVKKTELYHQFSS